MSERLFLLDVDDTLFDTVRYKKAISSKIEVLFPNTNAVETFWSVYKKHRDKPFFWHDVLKEFCVAYNCVDRQNEVFETSLKHDFSTYIFPDVRTALEQLKKFGILAIFSTGDSLLQQVKIHQSGLGDLVSHIFIFDDEMKHISKVGDQFPDHEIWFIDNHIQLLQQAQAIISSLHTALMIRGDDSEIKGFTPELFLHNLDELVEHFKK